MNVTKFLMENPATSTLDKVLLAYGQRVMQSEGSLGIQHLLEDVLSGSFLGEISNRTSFHKRYPRSRYSGRDDGAPMIIVPETTDRECIKTNSLSSIGFMAFVVSVINAVMQTANNINNNNNNRNNNDNDNNQNNNNVNIANLGSSQMNMNMVMGGRRRRRRDSEALLKKKENCHRSGGQIDSQLVLDASVLAVSYIELWIKTFHEEKTNCIASLLCNHGSEMVSLFKNHPNKRHLEDINQTLAKGFSFYALNVNQLEPEFVDFAFKAAGTECENFNKLCKSQMSISDKFRFN